MSSVVTVPLLRDAVDSFYQYVITRAKAQMAAIAPTVTAFDPRGGIVQARDWPLPAAQLNTPYLLLQSDEPIPYNGSVSQYQPQVRFRLSWAWMIQGDNIQPNEQAPNRGNKYGINMAIVQAMMNGHYPGFTEKLQWSAVDDGTGNPKFATSVYSPSEMIRWSMPRFVDKIDRTSGILFCSGNVSLISFAPAITS